MTPGGSISHCRPYMLYSLPVDVDSFPRKLPQTALQPQVPRSGPGREGLPAHTNFRYGAGRAFDANDCASPQIPSIA